MRNFRPLAFCILGVLLLPSCKKPAAPVQAAERYAYFKVIARGGLNLREQPSVTAKRLLTIPQNTTGEILQMTKESQKIQGRSGYWVQVKYNGQSGWIFSGFVLVAKNKDELFPEKLNRTEGSVEEIAGSTWSETGEVVKSLNFKDYAVTLSNIAGVPTKDASGFDRYCGAPPRRVVMQHRANGMNYVYEPPKDSEGAYNPELIGLKEVFENVFAVEEFNGRCSCSGYQWHKLMFLTGNGAYAVRQEIEPSPGYCSIERNESYRAIKTDPAQRRIFVVEREPECIDESGGASTLRSFAQPTYTVITMTTKGVTREVFKPGELKPEYQPVFDSLDKPGK